MLPLCDEEERQLLLARQAPRREESDEDRLAAERREANGVSLERRECKWRRRLPYLSSGEASG